MLIKNHKSVAGLILGTGISALILAGLNAHMLGTGSFWLPKWVAILAGGLLAGFILLGQQRARASISLTLADLLKILTYLYIGLSVAWAPDWKSAVLIFIALSGLCWVYLFFRFADIAIVTLWLPATVMLSIALSIAVDFYTPLQFGGYGNDNVHAETILLSLPLIFLWQGKTGLIWKRLPWIVTSLAVVYLLVSNISRMEMFLLPSLALAMLAGWGRPRLAFLMGGGVPLCILILYAAILNGYSLPGAALSESLVPRAEIAANSLMMWLDAPLIGLGPGAFFHSYPEYEQAYLVYFDPPEGGAVGNLWRIAQHAHNEYLQYLVEVGLVGLGLLVLSLATSIHEGMHIKSRSVRISLLTGVFLLIMMCGYDFPLHNPSTALLTAILMGCLENRSYGRTENSQSVVTVRNRRLYLIGVIGLSGLTAAFLYLVPLSVDASRAYRISRLFMETRPKEALEEICVGLDRFDWFPETRLHAFISYANTLSYNRVSFSDRELAEELYAISRSAAPYHRGLLLARFQDLIASREEYEAELEELVHHLQRNLPQMALGYLIEASLALENEDWDRASASLIKADHLRVRFFEEIELRERAERLLPQGYRS